MGSAGVSPPGRRMEGENLHFSDITFAVCGLKLEITETTTTTHQQQEQTGFCSPSPPPLSPPYTYPCFQIRVGALLSEHDVLSTKSCSHLPRHKHKHVHTNTQPAACSTSVLQSSALRRGFISPPPVSVLS